jgi:hypothetical protein
MTPLAILFVDSLPTMEIAVEVLGCRRSGRQESKAQPEPHDPLREVTRASTRPKTHEGDEWSMYWHGVQLFLVVWAMNEVNSCCILVLPQA